MPGSEAIASSLVFINTNTRLTCVGNSDQEDLLLFPFLSPEGHESACNTVSLLITDSSLLLLFNCQSGKQRNKCLCSVSFVLHSLVRVAILELLACVVV